MDAAGQVAESSAASIALFERSRGWTAPRDVVFGGVTLDVVEDVCRELELPFRREAIEPQRLAAADEVLLCNATLGLRAVTRLDGRSIGGGHPGPAFARLAARFAEVVGLDPVAQALAFLRTAPGDRGVHKPDER